MSRTVWLIVPAVVLALSVALGGVFITSVQGEAAPSKKTVKFGLVGEPWDPAPPSGGVTRDRNEPSLIVIEPGQTIEFKNRSGGRHQVALLNTGIGGTTTWTDVSVPPVTPPPTWVLNDGVACSGGSCPPDVLAISTNPDAFTEEQRTKGAIDFSYKFTEPGQYLALCNFRPHTVNYRQGTFIVVREPDERRGNDND